MNSKFPAKMVEMQWQLDKFAIYNVISKSIHTFWSNFSLLFD